MNTLGAVVGLAVSLLCQGSVVDAQAPPAGARESTVVVMLGTGTPRPLPDVWGPATAVTVGGRVFLVDAGVGVERRLAAAGVVRVTAFLVNHGEWREAYGYRFDSPGRSIVLWGDTRPSEELVRMATGVDVLIHEVQPSDSTQPPGNRSASDWASYVRAYHTTALQLGELAARARPKLLVVYHNGRRVRADRILADIRRSFSGPVAIAADLQRS